MESLLGPLLGLLVVAIVVRFAIFLFCPNVENILSGPGMSDSTDDYQRRNQRNEDDWISPHESEWMIGPFAKYDPNYSPWIGKKSDD